MLDWTAAIYCTRPTSSYTENPRWRLPNRKYAGPAETDRANINFINSSSVGMHAMAWLHEHWRRLAYHPHLHFATLRGCKIQAKLAATVKLMWWNVYIDKFQTTASTGWDHVDDRRYAMAYAHWQPDPVRQQMSLLLLTPAVLLLVDHSPVQWLLAGQLSSCLTRYMW